jgi:hypothetical protein
MTQATINVQTVLRNMAYNRSQFKDRVEEKVGGALLEYYKAQLAALNRQTRWAQHWNSEVTRLLDTELVVTLLHSIRGFKDRKKAVGEVLQQLRAQDEQYRRAAERVVRKDYGLKQLDEPLTHEIANQFFSRVESIVGTHA